MTRLLASIAFAFACMISGNAYAQNLYGSGSSEVSLDVMQTVGPVPCTSSVAAGNATPFSASGGSLTSTTGATTSSPVVLCNIAPGLDVYLTQDVTISPIAGDFTGVMVNGITANALAGTCGPANIRAQVVSFGPPLILYIPWQSIPGNPLPCWVGGYFYIGGAFLAP